MTSTISKSENYYFALDKSDNRDMHPKIIRHLLLVQAL